MPQRQSFLVTIKIIQKREGVENWLQFNPLKTSAGERKIASVRRWMWPLDFCHSSSFQTCIVCSFKGSHMLSLSEIQDALTCILQAEAAHRLI